jgi:hypothetical protein
VLGRPAGNPAPVIYVDYEMSQPDILERLLAFGYNDPDELASLYYVLMPDVAALDTPQGGTTLVADVERTGARLVVIDTTGRAVSGEEDRADTYLAFARHTGRLLKRAGVTWIRLDHAGKNPERGQRGTSAKNDDVDIVWRLTGDDNGFDLRATHRRVDWVPRDVRIVKREEQMVLSLVALDTGWPAGTAPTADILDRLELPLDTTVRAARAAFKEAGETADTTVLAAALRWRRERSGITPGQMQL